MTHRQRLQLEKLRDTYLARAAGSTPEDHKEWLQTIDGAIRNQANNPALARRSYEKAMRMAPRLHRSLDHATPRRNHLKRVLLAVIGSS